MCAALRWWSIILFLDHANRRRLSKSSTRTRSNINDYPKDARRYRNIDIVIRNARTPPDHLAIAWLWWIRFRAGKNVYVEKPIANTHRRMPDMRKSSKSAMAKSFPTSRGSMATLGFANMPEGSIKREIGKLGQIRSSQMLGLPRLDESRYQFPSNSLHRSGVDYKMCWVSFPTREFNPNRFPL